MSTTEETTHAYPILFEEPVLLSKNDPCVKKVYHIFAGEHRVGYGVPSNSMETTNYKNLETLVATSTNHDTIFNLVEEKEALQKANATLVRENFELEATCGEQQEKMDEMFKNLAELSQAVKVMERKHGEDTEDRKLLREENKSLMNRVIALEESVAVLKDNHSKTFQEQSEEIKILKREVKKEKKVLSKLVDEYCDTSSKLAVISIGNLLNTLLDHASTKYFYDSVENVESPITMEQFTKLCLFSGRINAERRQLAHTYELEEDIFRDTDLLTVCTILQKECTLPTQQAVGLSILEELIKIKKDKIMKQ